MDLVLTMVIAVVVIALVSAPVIPNLGGSVGGLRIGISGPPGAG